MFTKNKAKFTVGICAYNEEKNIGRLVEFILAEKYALVSLAKIVVVASGCTDRTVPIVSQIARTRKKVQLIVEKERKGKSSAVNLVIAATRTKKIVLISADILPARGTIEKLVIALKSPEVGMVGGRPIPKNDPKTLIGYAVHLEWRLHHLISLKKPKGGEMIAFKRIFKRINPKSAVDEAVVEGLIAIQGYKIGYIPEAIVYNWGPRTVRDFLRQRRRIYAGHLATKKHYGYSVSTFEITKVIPYVFLAIEWNWRFFIYTPIVAALEMIARSAGFLDYYCRIRDHSIWKVAKTAKRF